MPGRTQQLNFFNLGGRIHLVDMPGYGYAKVSKQIRADWDALIFNYLRGRVALRCVFILVDARQGLRDTDHHLMDLLDQAAVPYRAVLTKIDKVSEEELEEVKAAVVKDLKKHPAAFPDILETSAQKSIGLEELRALIISLQ
jgi:GTP-binding protein